MIGVFDSGVGGMTVARAIEQLLPEYPLIYLGDIARAPYGPKSAQTICRYAEENVRFLIDRGAKIIVIACNSAASVATDTLRQTFATTFIEVITPAVQEALRVTRSGRIGVIGTSATIHSRVYEKKILGAAPQHVVIPRACPLLVPLVEEGWLNRRETKMILRRYLHPLKSRNIDTLVLGCTHYPLLRDLIAPRMGKNTVLVDSSKTTARYLEEFLEHHGTVETVVGHRSEDNRYFVTDLTTSAGDIATRIFARPITLRKVSEAR